MLQKATLDKQSARLCRALLYQMELIQNASFQQKKTSCEYVQLFWTSDSTKCVKVEILKCPKTRIFGAREYQLFTKCLKGLSFISTMCQTLNFLFISIFECLESQLTINF